MHTLLPGDELLEDADVNHTACDARMMLEPASWVMERKMLRGIKQRAEHRRSLASST